MATLCASQALIDQKLEFAELFSTFFQDRMLSVLFLLTNCAPDKAIHWLDGLESPEEWDIHPPGERSETTFR